MCVGSNPVACAAIAQCTIAGTCNPSTGACSNPAAGNGAPCDDAGYEIPPLPLGSYTVCAEAPGLPASCAANPVVVTATSPLAVKDFTLVPGPKAVTGHVLLADGTPCYHVSTLTGVTTAATVSFVPAGDGGVATGPSFGAAGGPGGAYVVDALPGAGAYTVTATCGAAQVQQSVTFDPTQSGDGSLDITIPNHRPRIRGAFVADAGTGARVRSAAPGAALVAQALVSLFSPHDGDVLLVGNAVALDGLAQDPGGTGPLTYQWLVDDSSNVEHVITGGEVQTPTVHPTFSWLPETLFGGLCGGTTVTIKLQVMGPGGTAVQAVTVTIIVTC